MPGIVDVPGVEVWGRGRSEYTLPCGHVDEHGKVHKQVIFRETTGVEEDMMDDDEIAANERMSMILSDCCEKLGDIVDKEAIRRAISDDLPQGKGWPVTSSDRIAMMIFLRRTSVSDVYKFERRCPRCGHLNRHKTLDLRKLKITEVPEDRAGKRRVEITLPGTGKKAIVRVLTAKTETALTNLRPNQKDLRSAAILARLDSIEVDVPAEGGTKREMRRITDPTYGLKLVKELPQRDRNFLRRVYHKMEADVDTLVEVSCDGRFCTADFAFPLDLGQSFFSNPAEEHVSDEALNWL
jgi:hypothetical protein